VTTDSQNHWPWWKDAVFYQIYPRSFCLADPQGRRDRLAFATADSAGGRGGGAAAKATRAAGTDSLTAGGTPVAAHVPPAGATAAARVADGAGDLEGIRRHLNHLVWLGVDAIWLSPFYRSPMKDFGYDVSDYCAVDALFGTNDDFDGLLGEAHERGLRVIVDFVPNHTSDQHPWFLDARSSRLSAHRNFYVWRDPDPDDPLRPPNNWRRAFGDGPAWTFDDATGQWYLHLFLPEQPDLDWSNPEVVDAMEGVLGYWLERGVDGFRIDVVHDLGKDPALADAPDDLAAIPWTALNDDERTHPILRRLRRYVDGFPQEAVTVGEVFLLKTALVAKYYGHDDELHLSFNFRPMFCAFEAPCFQRRVSEIERLLGPIDAWPTWVLSSHDRPRHRTRYGGSERRARAAAVMLLGMRGTPFLYAGEELGLEDAVVPDDHVVDPGGRDGCRAPIPWDDTPEHGWDLGGGGPWLPFPPEADRNNVASLSADPSSILHLYRRLLALRRATPLLRRGDLDLVESGDQLLAVRRHLGDDERWVIVNFSAEDVAFRPPAATSLTVEISSGGDGALSAEGSPYGERLGPEEAVVLRPG
jgi:alpha-glucosidase